MAATTVGQSSDSPEHELSTGSIASKNGKTSMLDSGPRGICVCVSTLALVVGCVIFAIRLPTSTDDKEVYYQRQPGTCTLLDSTGASRSLLSYRCKKKTSTECLKSVTQNKAIKCVESRDFDSWSLTFLNVTHTPEDGGSTSNCELKHRDLSAAGVQRECIPSSWCFKDASDCDDEGKRMPGAQACFVTDEEKGYCSLGTRDSSEVGVWVLYLVSVISVVILSILAACFCGACLYNTFKECGSTKDDEKVADVEQEDNQQKE